MPVPSLPAQGSTAWYSHYTGLHNAAQGVDYTGTFRGPWAGSTAYAVGDVVVVDGGLVRCVTAHTSITQGWRYNRADWAAIPVPLMNAGTHVPVRGLDTSRAGADAISSPPRAGVFQQRPKQFDYSAERTLWSFQSTTGMTTTGTTSLTAGTTLGGSVVVGMGATPTLGYLSPPALTTPVNLTGHHIRTAIKVTNNVNRFIALELSSAGNNFTNCIRTAIFYTQVDGSGGEWWPFSAAPSEFDVIGTGANIAAINGMRFLFTNDDGTAYTTEVAQVSIHPNTADIAKVIFWLDDGSWANHRDAIKIAAGYGFPVTLAYIADNLVNSTGPMTGDEIRYAQDRLGAQVTTHAFGPQDHNRVQTGQVMYEQLLSQHHFGLAMGYHGVEDITYWSSGHDGEQDNTLHRMFRSARGGRSRIVETLPPGNPYITRAMMIGSETANTHFIPYAQRAVACKGVAQYVWHSMDATALAEFSTFCAWLDTNRATVRVTTPQGAYDPLCH